MSEPDVPWWKSAVVYQIYPRSFCDTNGDGVGDLAGVRSKLDHLVWLGVGAIWLSPFFRSPMKDYGYDVSDYCDVDPLFGTLDDFDGLLADAHARGLRVLIDWVPNHSSDRHPWFQEARRSRDDPRRDWYVWRAGSPDQPPNNWRRAFSPEPAWTFDEATREWYLHLFLPEQPDLNWGNAEVESAMHDTLRFWLDRGVDGFRMDVIHAIGKDPALADVPEERADLAYSAQNDDPRTHVLLRRIRSLLDSYPGDRVSVGEVFLLDTERVADYYGKNDELHLSFNFRPLFTRFEAGRWRAQIERTERAHLARNAWPTWVLSNHDNPRHRTRYGSEARARVAAMLLLTLRGTPFLYAGEELGLDDAEIPAEARVDPGGRDGCRAPIPWTSDAPHGWNGAPPWLPWPPDPAAHSAERARSDPHSVAVLYRDLLAARRASPALQLGSFTALDAPEGVLAYRRMHAQDERVVLLNFTGEPQRVALPGSWRIQRATDDPAPGPFRGRLDPDQGLLLDRS